MNAYRTVTLIALAAIAVGLSTPNAQAQSLQEKISVTFSAPVEVPGTVLPAGTYVFEAVEDGHLTRILNAEQNRVYATLITVPNEMSESANEPVVKLTENSQGSPEKVQAWFYPGDPVGNEFLYRDNGSTKDAGQNVKARQIK